MKTIAIIQARMGSTRLPNKVLKPLAGKPMLIQVYNRVRAARHLNEVIIATTTAPKDNEIDVLCKKNGISCYRGSENDVLDRYYQAATLHQATNIARITADCPLIDPGVIDLIVDYFLKHDLDYASNTHPPTYPDGLDTEIFSYQALERAWKEARLQSEREHVTPYIWKNPSIFKIGHIDNDKDLSHLRWTVDEPDDYEFISRVYENFPNTLFSFDDILNLLNKHLELNEINIHHERDEGYKKSITDDKLVKD